METKETTALAKAVYGKYGDVQDLNDPSLHTAENRFLEIFPRRDCRPFVAVMFLIMLFKWLLRRKMEFTKEELAQILITNEIVSEKALALEIVDEMVNQEFAGTEISERFKFGQSLLKDGTILYILIRVN